MSQTEQILLGILTSLPGVFIAAVVAYYFSQRKYTFERLHDKKLNYLEEIYGKIISLEKDLKKYVYTTGSMNSTEILTNRKAELKPIQNKFFELQEYFWKKEILLNNSSIIAIQSFVDTSVEILSKLQVSNISLEIKDFNTSDNQWNDAYKTMKGKLDEAKTELKNDFRKVIEC